MADPKKRQVFKKGHHRKFLVVIDDSPEFEQALYFAARVANRTGGRLAMLYVNQPMKVGRWLSFEVSQPVQTEGQAEAAFNDIREHLLELGFDKLKTEAIVRSGDPAEEIVKVIERDEDIAILVLGAGTSSEGPGPLVSSLAMGSRAGRFPIPIYIVPGTLTHDEIAALA